MPNRSKAESKSEIVLVLPQRARVRIRSRPVFVVGVTTEITVFQESGVPSPLSFQTELDATSSAIVYRPPGGNASSTHTLEQGVYTIAFSSQNNQVDTQRLRLEVDAEFIPPASGTNP